MIFPFSVAMGQVAGLPPSVTYLSQLDQLIVKQKKELMESKLVPRGLTACETSEYSVFNFGPISQFCKF